MAFAALIVALVVSLALLLALPQSAFAAYSNPSVRTIAQMRTDGSLHVVEQRSFAFDEDYSAIKWPFTGITDKQEVEISEVRIIQMDEYGNVVRNWTPLREAAFQSAWRDFVNDTGGATAKVVAAQERMENDDDMSDIVEFPTGDAYSFDERRNNLYIFLDSTELSTVIECDYAIDNAALVYDDTAEMYWDYVTEQPDVEMENVRTQIQLPVPDGVEVVSGQTILAWGHGPEGTVDVRADGTVHYDVPLVREGQYAQAHVLFPRSWLTNITVQSKLAKSGTRFDDAVAEEAAWTDTYTWGVVNSLWMGIAVLLLCIVALVAVAIVYVALGRERRPDGGCEGAARHVDAAVLGRLLRWNHHSAYDFATTLRELERRGTISISQDGPDVGDVRFRITPSAKSAKLSAVEQGAMRLLFDTAGDGYQSVSLAEVQRFCSKHPKQAREAMKKWQDALSVEVNDAGVFDVRSRVASWWLAGIGVAFVVVSLFNGPISSIPMFMLLITGAVYLVVAYNMPHRTPLGVCLAEEGVEAPKPSPAPWEVALCNAFGDTLTA